MEHATVAHMRKKFRRKRAALIVGIIFFSCLSIAGGLCVYANHLLGSITYKEIGGGGKSTEAGEQISGSSQDPMVLNVALFGLDKYPGEDDKGRSDSIMILSINNREKTMGLTSVARDTYVEIPGHVENRVNVAYALSGEELATKTLEKNFGVKIDRFVTINFEACAEIIDTLGGVQIPLTSKETRYINNSVKLHEMRELAKEMGKGVSYMVPLKEVDGVQSLNGIQALAHMRNRTVPRKDCTDDYARAERQRETVRCVKDKLKSSSAGQILKMVERMGPYIRTSFTRNEILILAKNALKYAGYAFKDYRVPQDAYVTSQNIRGMAVQVVTDWPSLKRDLSRFIYGK